MKLKRHNIQVIAVSGVVWMLLIGLAGCSAKNAAEPEYSVSVKGERVASVDSVEKPADSAGGQKSDPTSAPESQPESEKGPAEDQASVAGGAETEADPGGQAPQVKKTSAGEGFVAASQASEKKDENAQEQPKPEEASKKEPDTKKGRPIVFNFDNAELTDVIRNLAGQLGVNYMFDVEAKGKVTVHTAGELYQKDLWPLFFQILEANGLTAVNKGGLYHIVELKDAARMPITSRIGSTAGELRPNKNMIIQIIPLKHIGASEIAKLLKPFISDSGQIISHDAANTLVVVDSTMNMAKILELVRSFDMSVFETMKHRFYPLEYVGVEETVKTLKEIFSVYKKNGSGAQVSFVGLTRLNTVLALSSTAETLDKADNFISEMDVPGQGNEPKIYVYSVEKGRAGEIAELLSQIFSEKASKTPSQETADASSDSQRNPFAMGRDRDEDQDRPKEGDKPSESSGEGKSQPSSASGAASGAGGNAFSSGTLRGEVRITPDETRNNIIIEAIPSDYQIIQNLLRQIDVLPRQVLIKMTIAEVSLDEETELGVEWSYVKSDEDLSTSLLEATLGKGGFKYTIGNTDRWTSALSALASENKVNILSSPSILASNSKDAQIDVTTEVPVASSEYEYTSGESPVVSTDIEYRDTGVILSVTPHINEVGLVTMEIDQEISEVSESVQVAGTTYPAFFKRSAQTTLTVKSGQTIVIGGLIKETNSNSMSGAPWFINLPVVKFLFGQKRDSLSKTELIIFISPSVITELDDIEAVTNEFKRKVRHILPENM